MVFGASSELAFLAFGSGVSREWQVPKAYSAEVA